MSKKPRKKTAPAPSAGGGDGAAAGPEAAALTPTPEPRSASSAKRPRSGRATESARRPDPSTSDVTVLLECQAGLTRGLAMMGQAMLGLTRESMQGAAETGLALIDTRSLPMAWALGMQLARDQVDRVLRSSAELTDIGWRTATAACGPLLDLAKVGLERIETGTADPR
jgi:phasin protein